MMAIKVFCSYCGAKMEAKFVKEWWISKRKGLGKVRRYLLECKCGAKGWVDYEIYNKQSVMRIVVGK